MSGRGLCLEGVSVPGGSLSRGSLSAGGICPQGSPYPSSVDRMTDMLKALPSLAIGNN